MTDVRSTKTRSSLARKMAAPGGRTVAEAIARAEKGLEGHRDEALRRAADHLDQLEIVCRERGEGSDVRTYELASAVLDTAGFFETGPLFTAAFSLCELSDRMLGRNEWDWPSVEVHLRAMRLILTTDCKPGTAADTILEGLAAVTRRYA